MNDIFDKVKQETFLFSDDEIKNKIKETNIDDAKYIVLYLYQDRKTLTKDEYINEIKQYLYNKCFDTKEHIDKEIKNKSNYLDIYYNEVLKGKNDYFHAVQKGRNHLLHFLTY